MVTVLPFWALATFSESLLGPERIFKPFSALIIRPLVPEGTVQPPTVRALQVTEVSAVISPQVAVMMT